MKPFSILVLDPSGHQRTIRIPHLPFTLGTQVQDKNGLRDSALSEKAVVLELRKDLLVLRSIQDDLLIRLGDLKFPAIEVPEEVFLKIGETQIKVIRSGAKAAVSEETEKQWHTISASGLSLIRSLKKASCTRLSIYLSGETGTGKEVLAKLVHRWSERAVGPFVPINCGALPLTLVESELFGHVKGAFTGASRDRSGAFLQAHGGTLFLDEVGDLPLEVQVKLLRFLENGEIRPVGSDRVLHADVRIVCATHKPLKQLVEQGKFRQDLYFRLASIPVEIPTLRSRPEDIKALAVHFAETHSKVLTPEALMRLQAMDWLGNVRELQHAIERAAGLAGPLDSILHASNFDFLSQSKDEVVTELSLNGVCTLIEMERVMILRALKLAKGNRSVASKSLGIARSTLFEMLKRHQIVGPRNSDFWLEKLAPAENH